ncbi:hypothetical protein C5S39_06825 [Candidatus Methanophagaceae archaeon]|nr:hypothetical protein C5S39_06825 [Methanophagales archaeon]
MLLSQLNQLYGREEILEHLRVFGMNGIYPIGFYLFTSNVETTHFADKKDFRFLPEFSNHKIQISNTGILLPLFI